MYVSTSQSIVCEWHQFQGINVVIYSQHRQNFRACGGQKTRALRARGNLITPSRTRRRATSGAYPLHTGTRGHTDHTDEPHNYPPKPNDTNPHENRTDHTDRYVGTNERPENSRERQYFLTNLATMCLA